MNLKRWWGNGDSEKLKLERPDQQDDKEFPCTICKNWPMLVPIYQCSEGHTICSPCSQDSICTMCETSLPKTKIRNRALELLQPELIKCKEEGCDGIFANGNDMKVHIRTECNFINVSLCQILELDNGNCEVKCQPGRVAEAVQHIREAHGIVGCHAKSAFEDIWSPFAEGDPPGSLKSGVWFVAQDEALVVMKLTEANGRRWIQIVALGNRKGLGLQIWNVTCSGFIMHKSLYPRVIETAFDFKLPLVSVTDEDTDVYKETYTLDLGSARNPLVDIAFQYNKWMLVDEVKTKKRRFFSDGSDEEASDSDSRSNPRTSMFSTVKSALSFGR